MRAFDPTKLYPALITIQRGVTALRWTTHHEDVTIDDVTWPAAAGAAITAMAFSSDGTESNADLVIHAIADGPVEPGDGARGLLDGWPITIQFYDPETGSATEISSGAIVGSVTEDANSVVAMAASGQLVQTDVYVTEHYSLIGREDLGDDRCKIPIMEPEWLKSATGEATGAFTIVLDSLPDARATDPTWYVLGALFVRSGPLEDYPKFPIRAWDPDTLTVTLFLPIAVEDIPAGTDFELHPGCDNTREMCFSRFNNIVNLRAETFVPPPTQRF